MSNDRDKEIALAAYEAGDIQAAVAAWWRAAEADPQDAEVLVYLGAAFRGMDETDAAIGCFERALKINPKLPEVYYNLGNLQHEKGELHKASACYQQALSQQPRFTLAAYNLGNVCRDQGQLKQAVGCYKHALSCDPEHAPSYNNLGNILKHEGHLEEATTLYQRALQIQPDYPDALYNLGNAYYEREEFTDAIPWFNKAGIRDSDSRVLYCLYKTRQFTEFRDRLAEHCDNTSHHSPQVATLVAHHAINFGESPTYSFCPEPFSMVHQASIPELSDENSALRAELLELIRNADIDERQQGRLHHGVQSSGNLFYREETALRQVADLVRREFRTYRERFSSQPCELIRAFPEQLEFESSWYIRMRQGGHLTSHIHETGWISGALYLVLPPRQEDSEEGCFELSLHGDDYPIEENAGNFPSQILPLSIGDIVLFPANLFHRTIPFQADAERVCIAFDLKPPLTTHKG